MNYFRIEALIEGNWYSLAVSNRPLASALDDIPKILSTVGHPELETRIKRITKKEFWAERAISNEQVPTCPQCGQPMQKICLELQMLQCPNCPNMVAY